MSGKHVLLWECAGQLHSEAYHAPFTYITDQNSYSVTSLVQLQVYTSIHLLFQESFLSLANPAVESDNTELVTFKMLRLMLTSTVIIAYQLRDCTTYVG